MKKQVRKLSLSRETVGALSEQSLTKAAGGDTVWSACFCTALSACCTNGCPSALCW